MDFLIKVATAVGLFWLLMQGIKVFKVTDPAASLIAIIGFILIIVWLVFGLLVVFAPHAVIR